MHSIHALGDRLKWDSDTSLSDASGSDFKSVDKKSPAASSQPSKSKKGSWKRSYDSSSSSPLRRGGGRGEKDAKLKSVKKLSLGRRGGESKTSGTVTLADLAQSVPRALTTSGKGTTGMESSSIGNGSTGHGDQMLWKGSMELELYDTTPSSCSRKSFSQDEESSLSECE